MFTLINLESATLLSERITLEDGRKAARAARLLSLKTKQRFQPRKIESAAVDTSWHDREEERFQSGEYIPLVEQLNHEAGIYELKHNVRLFAHISKKNPSLIAYTKDAIKGAQDKQSLLSIEAFVKMVCVADDETQAYLTLLQTNHAKAHMPAQFKLALTADEIEHVYTNYDKESRHIAASCMRHTHDELRWPRVDGKPFHPVRAYAGGDLAIAYMINSEGKTTTRALCCPDRKLYSRVYADSDALHKALQEAGYSKSSYYGGPSLDGARLSLIESDGGEYIAPFLDEVGRARVEGAFLVLDSDGDYQCQNTNGIAAESKPEGACCEHCEDSYEADELTMVYTDSRQRNGESWCSYCRESDAFYCEGNEEYFSDNVDSGTVNDQTYTQLYIDNNASFCEYYDEHTFDELTTVIVDSDGETQEWSSSAVANYAYKYNGDYYSEDLDYTKVIVERYCVQFARRWIRSYYGPINVWFKDTVEKIPDYLIENGEVETVEAKDGRTYLKDYVDHYPVARDRMDVIARNAQSIAA